MTAAPASASPVELAITSTAAILTLPSTDNYRDSTAVTITSPVALDVSIAIVQGDAVARSVSADTALAAQPDGTYSATVPVTDDGLAAGDYAVTATALDDATDTTSTPLTIGSGQVTALTLATTNGTTFFPSTAADATVTGTVSAVDETATPVPFSGTVTAGSASVAVNTADSTAATFSLGLAGQPLGTLSLVAASGGVSSNTIQLDLAASRLSSVSVSSQYSTFYPSADGYRDSDRITTTVTSTLPGATAITGSLKATRKGKTVATWPLSTSGPTIIAWNGRVHGKIKSGTYVFTAVATLGNKITSHAVKVAVSSKKLVSKTVSSTKNASSVIKHFEAFDEDQIGLCLKNAAKIGCFGFDTYSNGDISLVAYGTSSVPSAVISSTKYGRTPSVEVTAKTSDVTGDALWGYGLSDDENPLVGTLRKGTHTLGWHALSGASHSLEISMALGEYSDFITSKLKIAYKYYVLK